jgi:AcrR family transcriptional regulator
MLTNIRRSNSLVKNNLERIKVAALKLFVNYGYESTTIRKISDEVGLSVAGIYVHFKSKKEVFMTLFDAYEKQYLDYVITYWRMHTTSSLESKITTIFESLSMYALENKEQYTFLARYSYYPPVGMESEIRNKVSKWNKDVNEYFDDAFKEFMKKCNTKFESKEEMQRLLYIFVASVSQCLIKTKEDIDRMSILLLKALK